jgi:mRNA-degrading endonuclease RelE of RelBE toxin-antitoxin system
MTTAPNEILFFPRALRDLQRLDERYARQVLGDIEFLLTNDPWPEGKVKRLQRTRLWELKTGDYRTLFLPEGRYVVIARVVNRRDLLAAVERFDVQVLIAWLREGQE